MRVWLWAKHGNEHRLTLDDQGYYLAVYEVGGQFCVAQRDPQDRPFNIDFFPWYYPTFEEALDRASKYAIHQWKDEIESLRLHIVSLSKQTLEMRMHT